MTQAYVNETDTAVMRVVGPTVGAEPRRRRIRERYGRVA